MAWVSPVGLFRERAPRGRALAPRAALVFLLALTACAASGGRKESERRLTAPAAVLTVRGSIAPPLRFGVPSTAEISSYVSTAVDDAFSLKVRFVLLPEVPSGDGGEPLAESISNVVAPSSGDLELRSTLASGGVAVDGSTVDALCARPGAALAAFAVAALPSGVTVQVALRQEQPGSADPLSVRSRLDPRDRVAFEAGLLVRRGPRADLDLELALELAGDRPGARAATVGAPVTLDSENLISGFEPVHVRELLVLAARSPPAVATRGWIVPSPFCHVAGERSSWLLIAIDVRGHPDPGGAAEHARAFEQLTSDVVAERALVRTPRPSDPVSVPAGNGPVDSDPGASTLATREKLARVARRVGATILLDAAITLPDEVLPALGVAVEKGLARLEARAARAASMGGLAAAALAEQRTVGWELDLAVIELLLTPGFDRAARLLLERRFGAAFSDDFSESAKPILLSARRVHDLRELERLALKRNLLALEETRPSLRIRAARYMETTLGAELDGYDPVAPFEARHGAATRLRARLSPRESP